MPAILPLIPSEFNYTFDTVLSDITYTFDVRWNARQGAWYFDLIDQDGAMIIAGSKIMLGTFPGRRSNDPRFPPGVFIVYDNAKSGEDAAFDDLGVRVIVAYYTAEEYLDAF